jgi:hypothetical protein
MNKRWALGLLGLLVSSGTWAQTSSLPQTRLSYEDRVGPSGHTLIIDGKAYGPYKEVVLSSYSTSGTAAAFAVSKRDRLWVLAQGKETGPVPMGFDLDRLQVSDDGKVWVLTATRTSSDEAQPNETLLWVNGKNYGPYPELTMVDYAEVGGAWIAAVRSAGEEADVLVSGKSQGPFFAVDHAWVAPDGKSWGYAVSDSDGHATVTTSDRPATAILTGNFTNLYPREPHWGYSLTFQDESQKIVVDGQTYECYVDFRGLVLTPSGRYWAFEAAKVSDSGDVPIVVVNGKEYPGEELSWSRLGNQEAFTWTYRDGAKVGVVTLRLP